VAEMRILASQFGFVDERGTTSSSYSLSTNVHLFDKVRRFSLLVMVAEIVFLNVCLFFVLFFSLVLLRPILDPQIKLIGFDGHPEGERLQGEPSGQTTKLEGCNHSVE
jgi:hypothetical protein